MIVDELILKLQADLQDVKKALKNVESEAAKTGKEAGAQMGKAAGASFGDVFNAIAGAAVANTVKGFFSRAATEFNKMEAAFLRVDSIAKGFGRSIDKARKNVDDLANKGFLNLNQAASSYADAIALGFDEKQAKNFVDALSDIAAFQNTIGDGAAAVQSGLSGLLSNSAEKVENIGVPIKVLNMQYNENIKTMGKAAAMQKFYNGVLKESTKFSGDAAKAVDTLKGAQDGYTAATEKAMAAVGKGLEPVLKRLYKTGTDLAEAFAKWFGGLDAGTKEVLLIGVAFTALVPAILAVGKAFALLSLNPVILGITAIIAAMTALTAVVVQYQASSKPENIVKGFRQQESEMKKLGDRAKELEAINKRTADQERELIKLKDALAKKAAELGIDYKKLGNEVGSTADKFERLIRIQREQKAAELRIKLTEAQTKATEADSAFAQAVSRGENPYTQNNRVGLRVLAGLATAPVGGVGAMLVKSQNLGNERDAARRDLQNVIDNYAALYQQNGTAPGGAKEDLKSGAGAKRNEQRFIDTQKRLEQIAADQAYTIRKTLNERLSNEEKARRIADAEENARIATQAETRALRAGIAEYIEEKYTAEKLKIDAQQDEQIGNVRSLVNAKAISEKEAERQIQRIREANARKTAQITAESFSRTLGAANATVSGFSQLANARSAGGVVSGLGGLSSGIAGFSDKFEAFGKVGKGISAAGGAISLLTGLFGKSDAQRAREAEEQKRRDEEAKALLELQANYQKNMLAIQESQANLPFKNLQRQLRLFDIEAQRQTLSGVDAGTVERNRLSQRQSAIQGVLSSEAGSISEEQLFKDQSADPQSLIRFLSERAAQQAAIGSFSAIANSVSNIQGMSLSGASGYLTSLIAQLQSLSGQVPPELLSAVIPKLQAQQQALAYWSSIGRGSDVIGGVDTSQLGIPELESLTSEINRDIGIAENLLSVIEQSNQTQLEIAANTKKTAENTSQLLRPDRQRSFIDVGQGFISSLGQRISPSAVGIARSLSQQGLSLPSEIGLASTTSTLAKTLQERMAEAMEMQVRNGARANDLLSGILRATIELYRVMDGNPATVSGFDNAAADAWLADRERRRF